MPGFALIPITLRTLFKNFRRGRIRPHPAVGRGLSRSLPKIFLKKKIRSYKRKSRITWLYFVRHRCLSSTDLAEGCRQQTCSNLDLLSAGQCVAPAPSDLSAVSCRSGLTRWRHLQQKGQLLALGHGRPAGGVSWRRRCGGPPAAARRDGRLRLRLRGLRDEGWPTQATRQ